MIPIRRKTPDIEMEALLKRYNTKLQYFVGSIMNIADLQRVQVRYFKRFGIVIRWNRPIKPQPV